MSDKPRTKGDMIRELWAAGWTQTELSKHFGISRQAIRYHTLPHVNAEHKAYGKKWRNERRKTDPEAKKKYIKRIIDRMRVRRNTDPEYKAKWNAKRKARKLAQKERQNENPTE